MTHRTLTPRRFDKVTLGNPSPGIVWTADAIGRRIGRSADYVRRTLAKLPGTPVKRHGRGNLYALEVDLVAFLAQGNDAA